MVTKLKINSIAKRFMRLRPNDSLSSTVEEFEQRGIVHFEPCRRTGRWLVAAQRVALDAYRCEGCAYEYEGTWVQYHQLTLALPPNRQFRQFLRRLFPGNPYLDANKAHLSSLDPGYPASDEMRRATLGRHVDGAISEGKIMWHGVIVGVLLSDVLQPNHGNPVSWPGSHHELRHAFSQLGSSPTEAELSQLIANQCTATIQSKPKQLLARAGTITVMDHALHHGMAPNDSDTIRHAAYYRLPWQGTNCPKHVLDVAYFRRQAMRHQAS